VTNGPSQALTEPHGLIITGIKKAAIYAAFVTFGNLRGGLTIPHQNNLKLREH
jgi:hypothetical protein